jgi:hypothetical protein
MARLSVGKFSSSGSSRTSSNQGQLTDLIRKKAYELYEKRGRKSGHSMEDWLEAERIVRNKAF